MNISINKPYQMLENREIEFGNFTVNLQEDEVNELFRLLDEELNYGKTRENLLQTINDLNSIIDDLNDQIDELVE